MVSTRTIVNPDDVRRVDAAIAAAESATDAEIVVAVVERAGSHRHAPLVGGIVGALFAVAAQVAVRATAEGIVARIFDVSLLDVGGLAIAGFAIGAWATRRIPALERFFAGDAALYEECDEKAAQLYAEHEVWRTRARHGVMVCVALHERMVVIRADEAVESRVGEAALAAVADAVGDALVAGPVPDALIVAAERLGAVLSPAFPKTASDLNELPNHLLVIPAPT